MYKLWCILSLVSVQLNAVITQKIEKEGHSIQYSEEVGGVRTVATRELYDDHVIFLASITQPNGSKEDLNGADSWKMFDDLAARYVPEDQ